MNKLKTELKQILTDKLFLSISMPFLIVIIFELFFKISNYGLMFNVSVRAFAFSFFIGILIYLLLLAITGKNYPTTRIFCCILFIFSVINQIKIEYTGDAISFSDLNFLSVSTKLTSLISSSIIFILLKYIIYFGILGYIYIKIINFSKNNNFNFKNIKLRISTFTVIILIFIGLYIPNINTKNIFLDLVFENKKSIGFDHYTTNRSCYEKYTIFSGLYGLLLNNRFWEPDNYNQATLDNLLNDAKTSNTTNSSLGTPNIIIVFSEAWWNLDKLNEIEFDKELTSNFNKLKEEGKCIDLLTCTYGGMSENVAFQLLTGGSLNYFPTGYVPIMQLYDRPNSSNIVSIIKDLNKNNYETTIAFGKDYYNSEIAFKKLGFKNYIEFIPTIFNKKGFFISDEYITDEIINKLENKSSQKIFYMAETIQNHMPYIEKYTDYNISTTKTILSDTENDVLLGFAQGVYDADAQLGRLYEYIKQYNEPTILLFLGDHLPFLRTKTGNNLLNKFSYFNTTDSLEKTYRAYNTQALLLSNYDINLDYIPNILSTDLLLTAIVNNMDIEINDYYKWLYSTINTLPASNLNISIDNKGNFYYNSSLPNNMKKIYDLKNLMQYNFFIKNSGKE